MVRQLDDGHLDKKQDSNNYNYELSLMKEIQPSNSSPKIIQKRQSNGKGQQSQSIQVQYMNNLKSAGNAGNLSKMIAANTSVATTVLASDNQSMIAQQMTLIPKPVKQTAKQSSKSPSNMPANNPVDFVSISFTNAQKAHSPGLRRTEQQTMIQNHNNARKMLQPSKQLSQPMKQQSAAANRVQVSPININQAVSRELHEGSSPLVASQSNGNLAKRSNVSQSKVNSNSLVKNIQREGAQSFSAIVQNFTQKHVGRRVAVDLTPSVGCDTNSRTQQPSKSSTKREPYAALMRVIAHQRTEEARTFWVTDDGDQMSDEIRNVPLDQQNQNVITADCQRTRFLSASAKQQMGCVLTYYVKQEGISYKQGINEICLPFIWLECKRSVIPDTGDKREATQAELPANLGRVYEQLRGFILNYLPNIFMNDEFVALQCCMTLIRLLFRYHAPKLYCFLEQHQITVEMYSIPWIITFFSTKMDSPELALELWNKVAQQPPVQDLAYIFFFAVALLVENESLILASEFASLPVVMASLRIKDQRELSKLFARAQNIQENTPYSFVQLPELQVLMQPTSIENLQKIWRSLELLNTIPILPAELFFYCFPGECECANPNCANSLTYKKSPAGCYLPPETTSICPELDFKSLGVKQALKQTIIEVSPNKQGNQQSPYKKLLINADGKYAKLPSQLETESNLNYDMDNQESHIDMIHETARMKHLNAVDVNQNQLNIQLVQDNFETPDDFEQNSKTVLEDCILNLQEVDRSEAGDFCGDCKRRQSIKKKIDSKGGVDDSFEDLSSDCLINQMRFIAIDCRLNLLREEGTLPHSLSFDLTCTTKLDHLKKQVEALSMYKDTHHICLIGISAPSQTAEDIQATPKRKKLTRRMTTKPNKRATLQDFHDEALSILVEVFSQQGFAHVSSLPGGFQQVHELSQRFGFGLMDHDAGKRCWHCRQTKNSELMRAEEAIVVNNQGSPRITFQKAQLARQLSDEQEEDALYYLGNCDTPTLLTQHSASSTSDEEESKTGRGPLAGGWDYIPFGLRQVYEAASNLNKLLQNNRPDNRASDPIQTKARQLQVEATAKPTVQCLTPGKQQINPKIFSVIGQGDPPSQYYNRPTRLSDDIQERNQLSAKKIVVNARDHSYNRVPENGRINLKSEYNVGGQEPLLSELRNPQYQNQHHLQQQSQVKLISKVSGTVEQRQEAPSTIFTMNNAYSPQTKSRPRAGEVQPQDISKYRQMLQEQNQNNRQPQNRLERQFSDVTEKGTTNLNISNAYYNYMPSARSNFTSQGASSVTEYSQGKSQQSYNPSSTNVTNHQERHETGSQFEDPEPVLAQLLGPVLSPEEESYLLNGIVKQVGINRETYNMLTQVSSASQVSYVFTATRLPARKKNFQIRSQHSFNFMVPSKILITPFTVAILHKESEIDDALGRTRITEEVDSTDFEEGSQRMRGERPIEFIDKPGTHFDRQPQDTEKSFSASASEQGDYAVMQSRFYMYDLIKITSRKSTTKIITFYFRIPKLAEYPAAELEKPDILARLNSKPSTNYAFAFKRKEYEDVSMSFEFEFEEQAKMCIVNVSNLYKKLKNTQKRSSKTNETKIVTDESDMLKQLQVKPLNAIEPAVLQKQEGSQPMGTKPQTIESRAMKPQMQRNPQNPTLSRLTQPNPMRQGVSANIGNQMTPSQNSLHQKT